jgi:hypothetical protein
MRSMAGIALLILMTLAASGCGGGGSTTQPTTTSSPPTSPSPDPSSPSITSISPTSAVAGTPDLVLTINGNNFDYGSRAVWRAGDTDTPLASTLASETHQLAASVPAALLHAPGTVQVLVEDFDAEGNASSSSGPAIFSVTGGPAVFPAEVTLGPKRTQQFVATQDGNAVDATWSVKEGPDGGSISSSGLYTVPGHAGTFHVVANSVADPSQSATAMVAVVASGFTLTGSMNKARSGHTATLLTNGKVLILDSEDGSAEVFDPATGTFAPTGNMNTQRQGATATLLANGKVLVTGGYGPGTTMLPVLNTAELYDPLTGHFTSTGNMATARVSPTGTLLKDGRVLIAGGVGSLGPGGAIASAELYDPSTGTFTLTGSMNTERVGHTATLLASGKVFIAGGRNGFAPDSPDDPPWDPLVAELFDPSTGTFALTGSMSTTRIGHRATLLSDGKVLLLGGIPAIQNRHEQPQGVVYAEIYDPETGAFSATKVILSQDSYTATLLKSGQVLIAGGEEASVAVATAMLIDAANGTMTATGSLVTARKGHTATILNDGRVLVTGGTDSNGKTLATAEVYE